jgi:hypothetical protein
VRFIALTYIGIYKICLLIGYRRLGDPPVVAVKLKTEPVKTPQTTTVKMTTQSAQPTNQKTTLGAVNQVYANALLFSQRSSPRSTTPPPESLHPLHHLPRHHLNLTPITITAILDTGRISASDHLVVAQAKVTKSITVVPASSLCITSASELILANVGQTVLDSVTG